LRSFGSPIRIGFLLADRDSRINDFPISFIAVVLNDPVHLDFIGNSFETEGVYLKRFRDFIAIDREIDLFGEKNLIRRGYAFQTGGGVDRFPENIPVFGHLNVTCVDGDSNVKLAFFVAVQIVGVQDVLNDNSA